MNKMVYDTINETLYSHQLQNGLQVFILPKKGYHKTYVTLSTPLGSNVTTFDKNGVQTDIPYGVAHFLEHKLFEQDGKDVSELFANNGAQVNAYTMNNRTTYLFSCTDHVISNLELLLQFVFHPTFTQEGIDKEIGIISQEISMYEDDPNTAIYMGLLKNMYENHPVKIDILGTIESISTITKELLDDVHMRYYHPTNMVLFITGNIQPEEIIHSLEELTETERQENIPLLQEQKLEPLYVHTPIGETQMDVLMPNCLIGMKLAVSELPSQNIMKDELIYTILLDMLMGRSTTNYEQLLRKGYINDSFGMDVTLEDDYGFILIGGNTKYPKEFVQSIQDFIAKAAETGFAVADFERTKKQIIGGFIQALNSLEYIANQFTKYHFTNASLFDVLDVASTITLSDVSRALTTMQHPDRCATFTIFPKQKDE